ncbi:MAG: N-acetylmannosamine kinase [Gemmatimonadetes bacterium]|nr:N-acetylmannosamine kinase [Gemmatimonadota bacterium]
MTLDRGRGGSDNRAGEADVEDVIETVRRQYDGLTPSQKRIAQTVVEDPEFVAFATVDRVAQRLGYSPSTIVRFAYRVGLDGYQDLQDRVRTLIRSQMRTAAGVGASTAVTSHLQGSIYESSFQNDLEHLRRTVLALDVESLDRAVSILDKATRIFVSGDNTSYSVAYYTTLILNRWRGNAYLVRANGEGATRLVDVGPDDAVLVFTFPPYSRTVLRVVEWARAQGAATIGVTDHAISPAGRLVSVVLPVVSSGLGPHNTQVPPVAVANALSNALILRSEDRAENRYRKVNRLMSQWDVFLLEADDDA